MKIFDRLSQDLTSNVRLTVAESAEALPAVLVLLAGDADPAVRIAARYNPNLAAAAIQDIAAQQQRAQDWDLDPGQLADLADSSWSWIRLTVAQNPNAPPAVLDRLGRESAARIPAAVALNPSCPPEVLDRLSDQANDKIQAAIATHETMELFFQLQPGKNLPYGLFGCGCGHITRCKQHRNQFAFGWAC